MRIYVITTLLCVTVIAGVLAQDHLATLGISEGRAKEAVFDSFVGDTVSYSLEVIGMRVSQSRPDRGIITMLGAGQNQHGVRVISFESMTFVERRDPTPP